MIGRSISKPISSSNLNPSMSGMWTSLITISNLSLLPRRSDKAFLDSEQTVTACTELQKYRKHGRKTWPELKSLTIVKAFPKHVLQQLQASSIIIDDENSQPCRKPIQCLSFGRRRTPPPFWGHHWSSTTKQSPNSRRPELCNFVMFHYFYKFKFLSLIILLLFTFRGGRG